MPAGLLTTMIDSSSCTISSAISCGSGPSRGTSSCRTHTKWPFSRRCEGLASWSSTRTCPASIARRTVALLTAGNCSAKNTSSRYPARSGGTENVRGQSDASEVWVLSLTPENADAQLALARWKFACQKYSPTWFGQHVGLGPPTPLVRFAFLFLGRASGLRLQPRGRFLLGLGI